ncbi:hypothetical protein [Herbaspirillum sp. ST 5-3]|uniref:hypothetical protein n=1 Tax=Oxalobacteraceae TaxID=75682 RepID=UPI0010A43EA0|nr:hypothetical protein [Herbaspirillum sp. ST 5-3]
MRKDNKKNTLIGATSHDKDALSKLAVALNIPAYKVISVLLAMVESGEIDVERVKKLLPEMRNQVDTRIGANRKDAEKLARLSADLKKPAYKIASVLISMLENLEIDHTRVKELSLVLNT